MTDIPVDPEPPDDVPDIEANTVAAKEALAASKEAQQTAKKEAVDTAKLNNADVDAALQALREGEPLQDTPLPEA